ncbi:YjcB family protein [Enterobacillus tribolii]|uniref:Putative YjcB-like protein n=1 Tax=Enterobacillus tribolii TaxID=1487935 RepID=A0A370R3A2_9GAMM|nr:YjcB family protein [Enterobacillus tribolii]MBW7983973.1 hypothetical protein [Enterobacillus tribolii]RDK96912.1 putative YjcB-like protein [Enterobacillus tribolii]
MSALISGIVFARWELFSAVMMFFSSSLNITCRRKERPISAFLFAFLGLLMSCWFALGLLGAMPTLEGVRHFASVLKEAYVTTMSQMPAEVPLV